jgi:hypothetical protein
LPLAVEIARIPAEIRGYAHVKERHLKAARAKWDGLMVQWRGPQTECAAAGQACGPTLKETGVL